MKKLCYLSIMLFISVSLFGNNWEKIEYEGKGTPVYQGKKLWSNSSFKKIYKEAGADEALKVFNKGRTKELLSILPAVGSGLCLGFGYKAYSNDGEINPGYTIGGVGLLAGAMYLAYIGTKEKMSSIDVYNGYVDGKNELSFLVAPIITQDSAGLMLTANF